MSFAAEYSLWYTLVCLLFASAGTWFLYHYNSAKALFDNRLRWVLSAFRFLVLFILAFLLLGPLTTLTQNRTDKPIVVLAIDGSQSITAGKDSAYYRNEFVAGIQQLQQNLLADYEVKTYTFGNNITTGWEGNFAEKQTNISGLLEELKTTYSNQNLGAVVLATDGLYNLGSNPLYPSKELRVPVFAIAMGDTLRQRDVLIKQVKHNQLVFTGNTFPLMVDVQAYGFMGAQTQLSIAHNQQQVFSSTIGINGKDFFTSIPVTLQADEPGTQHYIVTISSLKGEVSVANNRFDVFINVIDGKQKIALIYQSPHPDIAAYKQSLEQNENYSLTTVSFDKVNPNTLKDYSLVMFHQLPGLRGEGINLVKAAHDQQASVLYITGLQTGLNYLSTVEPAVSVTTNRSSTNEVLPVWRSAFALFTVSEDEWTVLQKMPPLLSPYAQYRLNTEHDVLFEQQIGYVKTQLPLIAFGKSNAQKVGFVFGEGFWKWRLYDAALSEQKVTSTLCGKMVQYLATKNNQSRFRVEGRKRFDENEPVKLEAEVYNQSFELVNDGDVKLTLRNASGKTFNYTFSKTPKAYQLELGLLPVGNYNYTATTAVGAKVEQVKGQFAVIPLQVEFLQTTANHQLLYEMASETEGKVFYPRQLEALEEQLRQNETIKPVIYKQQTTQSWINLKWIFVLLLTLLTAEWFIRKWNGSI